MSRIGPALKDIDDMSVAELRNEISQRRTYDRKLQPHIEKLEHETHQLRQHMRRMRLQIEREATYGD